VPTLQEFGKTKLYLPKQEGLEVLSKEVSSSTPPVLAPHSLTHAHTSFTMAGAVCMGNPAAAWQVDAAFSSTAA
jgi:hypothetical protein